MSTTWLQKIPVILPGSSTGMAGKSRPGSSKTMLRRYRHRAHFLLLLFVPVEPALPVVPVVPPELNTPIASAVPEPAGIWLIGMATVAAFLLQGIKWWAKGGR